MHDNGSSNKPLLRVGQIAVLGLGHVGLPTALGLSELGWEVIGADTDQEKITLLQSGQCPFFEPGLQELLSRHLAIKRFTVTPDVQAAIRSASVLFICVGTPQGENGEADLTLMEALARTIAHNLNGYKLIIEKSTVPAITGQWIRRTIERYARAGHLIDGNEVNGICESMIEVKPSFDVASNPEFLQEGSAVENVLHPERVVCGVESARASEILTEIYRPLRCPILVTSVRSAEIIKHAANAFLATKISFVNMVGDLCEKIGADVTEVARGIGLDSRIGPAFLKAGIGYGGYCFPKDVRAFVHLAEEYHVDFSLLKETERINQQRVDAFIQKVRRALWVLKGKTIGILGLAFKPATDDIRGAPSLRIIRALLKEGAKLQLYDPKAMMNVQGELAEDLDRLSYCLTPYDAARDAHALLLLTEWEEFRQLDLTRIRDLMGVPILVDGRNLWEASKVRRIGFEYVGIGRNGVETRFSQRGGSEVTDYVTDVQDEGKESKHAEASN